MIYSERCLHGQEKNTCWLCNGGADKVRTTKVQREKESEEILQLREKYNTIKEGFKNFDELWTEEEYSILYENFKDICTEKSARFRKTTLKVAIELERTRMSIVWHYRHMFQGPYEKGGKVLVDFMNNLTRKEPEVEEVYEEDKYTVKDLHPLHPDNV
jgi:hypothetical protein